MSVGRICTRSVDVAASDETAEQAASRMAARNVGTLVVVDAHQCPVGIVTDRDITIRVVARGVHGNSVPIGAIMSEIPDTVTEDTPIESAISIMRRGGHRRLPVIDENRKLLGVVTLDDVLDLLSEEFEQIGKLIRSESPRASIGQSAGAITSSTQNQIGTHNR